MGTGELSEKSDKMLGRGVTYDVLASCPGEKQYSMRLHATETGMRFGGVGHLIRMQTR